MHTAGRGLGIAMQYFQNACLLYGLQLLLFHTSLKCSHLVKSSPIKLDAVCRSCDIKNYVRNIFIINPLPDDKFLDLTKLKAFADNKLNVAKGMLSLFDRVENTVGKGENADYQHFLLFTQYFPKPSFLVTLKVGIVW